MEINEEELSKLMNILDLEISDITPENSVDKEKASEDEYSKELENILFHSCKFDQIEEKDLNKELIINSKDAKIEFNWSKLEKWNDSMKELDES